MECDGLTMRREKERDAWWYEWRMPLASQIMYSARSGSVILPVDVNVDGAV